MGVRYKLTAERVAEIRQSTLPDSHFAKLWGLCRSSIHQARVGYHYRNHPIPPQPKGRTNPKGFAVMPREKVQAAGRRGGTNRAHWRSL